MLPKNLRCEKQVLLLIFWILAGALLLVSMTILQSYLNDFKIGGSDLLLPGTLGGLVGLLVSRSDLRWRGINQRFADSERRFRKFYQNTPALLHSIDDDGRLVYVSQSWLDCLGYQREDVIGQDFFEYVIAEDVAEIKQKHLETLRRHGEIKDVRYQLRHANGDEVVASITETAQTDTNGRLTESLAVMTDLADHQAAEERIEKLAYFDTLTGLPNRALLNDRMLQAMAQARRDNRQIGIFFFDLDRFKMINDTQGHAVGDLVLRSVAQRLKKFIREGDTFARLGGDEFVIIQADPNHDPSFTILARRVLETLNEPFHLGEREFYTTASIGVAIYPLDGDDPQTLLKSADTAMYVAKSRGRNNFQFFSNEMNAAAVAKSNLEARLRNALLNNDLHQHYQAQVNLTTGKIVGIEALLRMEDEQGRPIAPAEVIAVAEESGLIYPLGEWTLQEACRQAKAWQNAGLPAVRIGVNLSGHHIRQVNFIDQVEKILEVTGLEPCFLEIELAETSVMGHVNDIIMAMTDLKVRGIYLAIDDFGSGYSSLLYLMHFPIHRIKIAHEFINGIGQRQDYASITEAIIAMARSLDLSVSAVGVETADQAEFLRQHGCSEAQGKFFSAVMTAEEIAKVLSASAELESQLQKNFPLNNNAGHDKSKEVH